MDSLQPRTYLNSLYLLLAFPLGLFYFIVLVVGISAGIPLMIVWVGLLVLAAVFAMWYVFIAFERRLAIELLGEDIPPINRQDLSRMTLWQKFLATIQSPVTWKGLVYLFAKFPLGILSFVVVVTLSALSFAFVTMPLYYSWVQPIVGPFWDGTTLYTLVLVDTLREALIFSVMGLFISFVSLHIFNGLAWISGKFARAMLGNFSAAPSQPSAPITPAGTDPLSAPIQVNP